VPGPTVVNAPRGGFWRVGRGPDPLTVRPIQGTRPRLASGGNRYDPQGYDYGVLYFSTTLQACFAETLARLRPNLKLLALVEDEWRQAGFMSGGTVPADWRQRRTAVHVRAPKDALFVDMESVATHQFLRGELAAGLVALGVEDLDVATVRGPDRRVTQMISEWAYLAREGDEPLYAGIRYLSRLGSQWECWAVFEDDEREFDVVERRPITKDMPELQEVAELFGLTVF
jgi:hypothetical protein